APDTFWLQIGRSPGCVGRSRSGNGSIQVRPAQTRRRLFARHFVCAANSALAKTKMMNESNSKRVTWSAIAFAALVNVIALSFFFSPGGGDVEIWNNWMREISDRGLVGGYISSDTDYPPLAFIILAAVVKCAAAFGASPFVVLKCSLFAFLLATAACFYWFTRNLVITAALELALILNSMALGYLDIFVAPFLIAGLFFLQRGNRNLGFLLFAISCLTKWQPLIIAPFVCLYVLGNPQ